MKKLIFTQKNDQSHWVGNGFPVRSIFSYNDLGKDISPFLLMDYAGPADFPPTSQKLGVGEHPHRGFETVTIVYSGEVEHRDSSGGGGTIRPGDVQWMTAASGLVHEEFHGKEFARTGGRFEMIQLWINLPRKSKMAKPRYQGIRSETIPVVELPEKAGKIRVIAGLLRDTPGPAATFIPINLWDIRLNAGKEAQLNVPPGHTTALFVLQGKVHFGNPRRPIGNAELGLLEREGGPFTIHALEDTVILLLGGEPIDEPIVGYGPFVMNTPEEIQQAFQDYQNGKLGTIERIEGSE